MLGGTRLCTRRALLQNILFELKQPYQSRQEGELRLSLMDHLEPSEECPNGLLLIVDEAHTLPLRLMEELRLMTNFVRDGSPRLRLVLCGDMSLEERFANPKLDSFNQRIAARCYLHPLPFDETTHYVRSQITGCGGDPDTLLDEGVLRAVYTASDGVPRIVNQIMDHAFALAASRTEEMLSSSLIEECWADLQQLPAPWNHHQRPAAAVETVVVEFGELSDDFAADSPKESRIESPESGIDSIVDETPIAAQVEVPFVELAADEETGVVTPPLENDDLSNIEFSYEVADPQDVDQIGDITVPDVQQETPTDPIESTLVETDAQGTKICNNPFAEHFDEEEEIVIGNGTPEEDSGISALASAYVQSPGGIFDELNAIDVRTDDSIANEQLVAAFQENTSPERLITEEVADELRPEAELLRDVQSVMEGEFADAGSLPDDSPIQSVARDEQIASQRELHSDDELVQLLGDPASDPIMPETDQPIVGYADESTAEPVDLFVQTHNQHSVYEANTLDGDVITFTESDSNDPALRVAPTDDRDIIVIEDEHPTAQSDPASTESDYLDLLTRMRRD